LFESISTISEQWNLSCLQRSLLFSHHCPQESREKREKKKEEKESDREGEETNKRGIGSINPSESINTVLRIGGLHLSVWK